MSHRRRNYSKCRMLIYKTGDGKTNVDLPPSNSPGLTNRLRALHRVLEWASSSPPPPLPPRPFSQTPSPLPPLPVLRRWSHCSLRPSAPPPLAAPPPRPTRHLPPEKKHRQALGLKRAPSPPTAFPGPTRARSALPEREMAQREPGFGPRACRCFSPREGRGSGSGRGGRRGRGSVTRKRGGRCERA